MVQTDFFEDLRQRCGEEFLRRRLTMQIENAAHYYGGGGYTKLHLENIELLPVVLRAVLKATRLFKRGTRNCLDYQVNTVDAPLRTLPRSFENFTILQLSDMHLDAIPDGGARLRELVGSLQFDLCVLTGDFRFLTHDIHEPCLANLRKLRSVLACEYGVYAVLGNHDFIEMVPDIEQMEIRVLLNESAMLEKQGERLCLAGVDDPHFYGTADIQQALGKETAGDCTVLLCHSPEYYAEAAAAEVDYILCGHTHGGQVCLPGGLAVMTNASCPRKYIAGEWAHAGMRGYTSRGSGASGLVVRFHCPPEITLHRLRCDTLQEG